MFLTIPVTIMSSIYIECEEYLVELDPLPFAIEQVLMLFHRLSVCTGKVLGEY